MIEKGIIDYPDYNGILEKDKIEFFKKIKTNKLDAISEIFSDVAPEIVQQAALFVTKFNQPGLTTAIPGILRTNNHVMYAHEYIKEGDDWILYINFKTDKKQGVEFTGIKSESRIAVAFIEGVNYFAYEGSKKVFVISQAFAGSFGYIDLTLLNDFMGKKPEKAPYKLSNISQEAYLADAPAQLFGYDTIYYRDGDQFGFWMSFGTLVKFDEIDFNNMNIDGTPVSLVDYTLSSSQKFKKMLNAKSAGYASVIFDQEAMLTYLLKEAKEYVLTNKKEDLTRVCLEDLLRNVSRKGILGIVYQKVETLRIMYMPVFDYTKVKVEDIVGPALCFIYDDEYIWMHYDDNKGEICFMTYKGDVYSYEDSDEKLKVTIFPEATLTKMNKVNKDNFVLFTGFPNLEENNVVDIYFDGGNQVLKSKNSKFAIDITAFDDFYKEQTKSFNTDFQDSNEVFKTFGNNKYPFITGLVHYQEKLNLNTKTMYYEQEVTTMAGANSVIDAVTKKAYLNTVMLHNYGNISAGGGNGDFVAPLSNFIGYANFLIEKEKGKINKKNKKWGNPNIFIFQNTMELFSNGYLTFKDKQTDKYLTIKAETDKYTDYIMVDFSGKATSLTKNLIKMAENTHKKPDPTEIGRRVASQYQRYVQNLLRNQKYSITSNLAKKVKVCSETERYEFEKVSDNMYVSNKPTGPICNHAILFEDAFQRTMKTYYEDTDIESFKCEYIRHGHFTHDEHGYYIQSNEDLSDPVNVYIYNELGMIAAKVPAPLAGGDYFKLTPEIIINNNSKKEINGDTYNIFYIKAGYKVEIDLSKMDEGIKNHSDGNSSKFSSYQGQIAKLKTEQQEAESTEPRRHVVRAMRDGEKRKLKTGIDKKFLPVGLDAVIAYKQGKILVSIGGTDYYEPFITDNGLRINQNLYITDIDAFEVAIRNMMLSNLFQRHYEGTYVEQDIVDLQQVKLDKIYVNKGMTTGLVEFAFADVPCVINGILYQPGEKVAYTFDLDIDIDFIDPESKKRIVFWDISIEYQTIYPIDKQRTVTTASEILNNPNCFTVQHGLPITIALEEDNYIYEKKSQAVDDGFTGFFNFSNVS